MVRLAGSVALLAATLLVGETGADTGSTAEPRPIDLRRIERTGAWNDALACPPGACRAEATVESPATGLSLDALMDRIRALPVREPRTVLVASDEALRQLVFVQRTLVFRFPDTVRVQAVETADGWSAIIYSRSQYGTWDLGVNRRRVARWLALLTAEGRVE